ncbi:MAG: BTAD domain-containing putative transcriptional regulator [Nitriliruptorales bacterium]|nr:BTAD domain-containing putative transcriptional regulator [Nitriliruptorales bacterium]
MDAEGDPVDVGGPKPRGILAMLALSAGSVVTDQQLVGGIWDEREQGGSKRSVQVHVSSLRRALGSDTIERRGSGYVLVGPPGAVDLARFRDLVARAGDATSSKERLELLDAALDLRRGAPLDGLHDLPFAPPAVTRIETEVLTAMAAKASALVDAGRPEDAIRTLEELVERHPLHEPLRGELMTALYRAGRQAQALQVYEETKTVLADELGVDPSPQLQDLHGRILRQELPSGRDRSLSPPEPTPAVVSGVTSRSLVGRDAELAKLMADLQSVTEGQARMVLVGGEAGVGKSRLVEAAVGIATGDGFAVGVGNTVDLGEAGLPFGPVTEALRGLVKRQDRDRIRRELGPMARELARIVPELRDAGETVTPAGTEGRSYVLIAIADLLSILSQQHPVLLVLEDLHWGDAATFDVLTFLSRSLEDSRVCLLGTFRTDELHRRHPFRQRLGELTRASTVERLDLQPFDEEEVRAQVAAITGGEPDDDLTADIARRSGGNAFYVEELLAEGGELPEGSTAVSRALRDVVAARIERLPDASRRLLDVIAVVGRHAQHELLHLLVEADELARALRPPVEAEVLLADDAGYRFRHALVQEVVYDDLLPGERVDLHRRVADVLEENPDFAVGGAGGVDAEIAHHATRSHDLDRAVSASLRAAERARAQTAFEEELSRYEDVLEWWDQAGAATEEHDRLDVLEAAAIAAADAGRARRAAALINTALAEGGAQMDPERHARLRRQFANVAFSLGDMDEAHEQIERALELLADAAPSMVELEVLMSRAELLTLSTTVDPEEALPVAHRAVELAEALGGPEPRARAQHTLGFVLSWTGRIDEALDELEVARRLAGDVDDPRLWTTVLSAMEVALFPFGRRSERCAEISEEALRWLDQGYDRYPESYTLLMWVAYDLLRRGDLPRSEDVIGRLEQHHTEGYRLVHPYHTRATLRWMQGRYEEAEEDLAQARSLDIERWAHDVLTLSGVVAAERGRLSDVHSFADEYLAYDLDASGQYLKVSSLRTVVRAEVDAGLAAPPDERSEHVRRATEALERATDILDRHPPQTPGGLQMETPRTYLLMAQAELSRVTGPDPGLWNELAGETWMVAWRIYADYRRAEALFAVDEVGEGQSVLTAAHDDAVRLGLEPLVERTEELADAHGIQLEPVNGQPGD